MLIGTDVSVLNTSGFFFSQENLSKANSSSVSDSEVSLTYTILIKPPSISLGLRIAMNPYICTARMLSSPSVPARAKPTSGPLSGPSRVLVSVLSVCLAHKSGFSRNRRGTVVVCKARCVRRTSLYLLVYVWIVSSSLESANTSQLLGLLRMRARASEPSSAGGVQAYLPQESAVS